MARAAVVVTRVGPDDLDSLAVLWDDLRATLGGGLPLPVATLDRLRTRLAEPESSARFRVVAAWQGDEPVGVATMTVQETGPWWEPPSMLVSLLHVRSGARHRGVGQVLLAEAVAFADELGTDDIAANVPPQLRDANRFFARLGFSPYVTRRVTSAAALRRRLASDSGDRVVDLRMRQRSLRERARRARLGGRGSTSSLAADQP